ncbi:MAG: stage II sporulation protein M [Bacteroidota bacterium]
MKEIQFLHKNKNKWQQFEDIIKSGKKIDPDKLSDLYIQVMDDLSYARTFYPRSSVVRYLNQLSSSVHSAVYSTKRESYQRIKTFWLKEVPLVFYDLRKYIFISLLIISISVLIGAVSSANDNQFVRLILGDAYVNMTEQNIAEGDPLAVYKDENQVGMFFGITLNNIWVTFRTFAFGVLFIFGTAYVLFVNGVMLGAFHHMFYKHGVLMDAFKTVWIHGTLEISAIVIAGAAGILLGSSFLFPGTYPRMASFRMGAQKGAKAIAGLVPIFILAGLLESFVTRYTEMPLFLTIFIIGSSLFFVVFYYIVYPGMLSKRKQENGIN